MNHTPFFEDKIGFRTYAEALAEREFYARARVQQVPAARVIESKKEQRQKRQRSMLAELGLLS